MFAIDRHQVQRGWSALCAWTLGCAPVLYLAFNGGGWDPLVRGGVGLVAWWVLALGLLTGALPRRRLGRASWACLALLAAFTVWTGVAMIWTLSTDATFTELGREATYLGFLAVATATITVGTRRAALNGLTCALGVVALVALLSALYPAAFGPQPELVFFPGSRLSYPLGYADGEGELLALALPLLLCVVVEGRTLLGRALAAAGVPVVVLAVVLTGSRGGVLTGVVALVVLFVAGGNRPARGLAMLTTGAGAAIAVVALIHRHAVLDGRSGALAVSERHQLVGVLALTCAAVFLVQLLLGWLLARLSRPAWLSPTRRQTGVIGACVLGALVLGAVAADVPHRLSQAWRNFKQPNTLAVPNVLGRLSTLGGSHRYQYWTVALHAFTQHPLLGIGPGAYQYYWAEHEPFYEYIQNAHSLYLETMAETGIIGIVLLGALLVSVAGIGVGRVLHTPAAERSSVAAALAVFVGFCIAAAVDWVWQLPAIVLVMCLAAAIILVPGTPLAGDSRPALTPAGARWSSGRRLRLGAAALALLGLAAAGVPFAATLALRFSQGAAAAGRFSAALSDASTAQRLEPGTAEPWAQRALILEQLHHFPAAEGAIERATALEPVDWQLWLVAARIDAEGDRVHAAVAAYRRAHALDPLSPLTEIKG